MLWNGVLSYLVQQRDAEEKGTRHIEKNDCDVTIIETNEIFSTASFLDVRDSILRSIER
jgi:hypothetical protein